MKGERSRIRSLRGPVVLITVGTLFALQNFTPYDFGQTWPVLLIVFGLLSLLGGGGITIHSLLDILAIAAGACILIGK